MQPRIGSSIAPIVHVPLPKPVTPVLPKVSSEEASPVAHTQALFSASGKSSGISKPQSLDLPQDSQTLKSSVDQMDGDTVSEITGVLMTHPDISSEFAAPAPVKGVLPLGGDDTVLGSAFSLSQKPGQTSMTMPELGKLTSQDKLSIVGHGDADTFGGMKAEDLAQQLKDAGVTQLAKISLKGCNSIVFAQQLFKALQAQGIEVGRITGRTGDVAIASSGRTLVSQGDQLLHQAQGSKFEVTATGVKDVYAEHSVESVQAKSQEIESLGHSGKLGLEKAVIQDMAEIFSVDPEIIGRMSERIEYFLINKKPHDEICEYIKEHEPDFPRSVEATQEIIANIKISDFTFQKKDIESHFEIEHIPVEKLEGMSNYVQHALHDGVPEEVIMGVIAHHEGGTIPNIDKISQMIIQNVKFLTAPHDLPPPKLVDLSGAFDLDETVMAPKIREMDAVPFPLKIECESRVEPSGIKKKAIDSLATCQTEHVRTMPQLMDTVHKFSTRSKEVGVDDNFIAIGSSLAQNEEGKKIIQDALRQMNIKKPPPEFVGLSHERLNGFVEIINARILSKGAEIDVLIESAKTERQQVRGKLDSIYKLNNHPFILERNALNAEIDNIRKQINEGSQNDEYQRLNDIPKEKRTKEERQSLQALFNFRKGPQIVALRTQLEKLSGKKELLKLQIDQEIIRLKTLQSKLNTQVEGLIEQRNQLPKELLSPTEMSKGKAQGFMQCNIQTPKGPIMLEGMSISGGEIPESPLRTSKIMGHDGTLIDRGGDAEAKLLAKLVKKLEAMDVDPNTVSGTVMVYTNMKPCLSCCGIYKQIQDRFPKLNFAVTFESEVQF